MQQQTKRRRSNNKYKQQFVVRNLDAVVNTHIQIDRHTHRQLHTTIDTHSADHQHHLWQRLFCCMTSQLADPKERARDTTLKKMREKLGIVAIL